MYYSDDSNDDRLASRCFICCAICAGHSHADTVFGSPRWFSHQLFRLADMQIFSSLDKKCITQPADFLAAVAFIWCLMRHFQCRWVKLIYFLLTTSAMDATKGSSSHAADVTPHIWMNLHATYLHIVCVNYFDIEELQKDQAKAFLSYITLVVYVLCIVLFLQFCHWHCHCRLCIVHCLVYQSACKS